MNPDIVDIPLENFFEVIVIGGGTCSLAITARLCEEYPASIYTEDEHQRFHWLRQRGSRVNLINRNVSSRTTFKPPSKDRCYAPRRKFQPSDILVLDAAGERFMSQWDNQFGSCQIPYLRSPMFFHPDPVNVDGLVSFAHLSKRESAGDIMEIKNVVGKEYSKHQLKKLAKKNTRKRTSPIPSTNANHDKPGIIDINMRDWKDYYRPSTKLFEDFCKDIVDRYSLHNNVKKDEAINVEERFINVLGKEEYGKGFVIKSANGETFGCKICIVATGHRGEVNYPIKPFEDPHFPEGSCHTTHLFNKEVNFLGKELMIKPRASKSRSIVIVGGGLTSAQLAHVAANVGISKIYLMLRGPVKIKHFDFHLDWVTKYKNVKKSAFYMKDTDQERWEMIQEAREGGSFNPEYYKKILDHVKNGRVDLMKYTSITNSEWDSDTKTWKLLIKSKSETKTAKGEDIYFERELENIDYIYFATGITANVKSLDFLQPVIQDHDIECVNGFPCLTDNLQWNNDLLLFMIGKNASLRTGPSSANLDGARLGAERIGWYIQDLLSSGKLEWKTRRCKFCSSESPVSNVSLDSKLDGDSESEVETDTDEELSSFDTRLKLASGQMNWYSLLDNM
ncbi:predicted protein [Scheffersomyces stipitis CBS 6054]|uniref:Uncharacterized protein n=1 Tax=Scheffersomyces stipitis (strain ATCC 58785 / CBS 6054 / NBRC 10063 / NRRL Y-11545) TaxID=322104 RepID=A3LRV3_PICST|nr:predicted protein [Scheffersomyces stipitis CBS 6054]ABN65795.2 predicted protein [Scheffersomyces stipitis CBS 6054]